MEKDRIISILGGMGVSADEKIEAYPFRSPEDGEEYNVWRVTFGDDVRVLKLASESEAAAYAAVGSCDGALPRVFAVHRQEDQVYVLMEYVEGTPALRLDGENLPTVLDALIKIQSRFLGVSEPDGFPYSLKGTLERRCRRGEYLYDGDLETAYEKYLSLYRTLPLTFCHDDLLPFNVILSGGGSPRAVMVDLEAAGFLPYPTSFARLIAHGTEDAEDLFYLTEADREFAIRYYYDNFASRLTPSYEEYRFVIDCFLFYEYCEWVMLGNKYGNTDTDRFRRYFALAKDMAKKLL